ncbi:G8 domain-containing protein [Hyaloraphidium curvatum]|nr:G8 domain-containing protein [Hyaloraphidium curvatum]
MLRAVAALLVALPFAAAQCARDAFPTTAGGAPFPATAIPPSDVPSDVGTAARPITHSHNSEAVVLPRPPLRGPPQFDAAGCPHLQSGLLDWHSPATWGGVVPTQGAVTLPANSKILLSSCSISSTAVNGSDTVFGTITIPATSELIFGDAAIALRTTGIKAYGALRAGGPSCRLRSRVSITLHGARGDQPTNPAPDPWTKGIYVENGTISLHGTQYAPTWTRLAATARAGDSVIFVQDLPNWQPGQEVVLTTTDLKDARDFHRNEVRTISGVFTTTLGPNVGALRLTEPLNFTHYGGPEYQAEVALLSRDVLIQGNEATSEPTDTTPLACTDSYGSSYPCEDKFPTGFGGHVLVTGTAASANVSGVELYRMGQTNVLGRYPLHFHMMGSQQNKSIGATASDCSVHRSFFRCFAVHGTHFARVHENTAYDATGHCYFIEDGVEENNEFHWNFGAHVHSIGPSVTPFLGVFYDQYTPWVDENTTNLILPSDISAGVFYGTNPYNSFLGNAASGGWTGFSFPTLSRPVKLHANVTGLSPQGRPFLLFRGNSAHSTGFWFNSAGGVYVGGQLTYKGTWGASPLTYTPGRSDSHVTCSDPAVGVPGNTWCDRSKQLWLKLEDVKVFLANRGMQNWGDRSDIIRMELHDINLAANVFGSVSATGVLHTCRTANKPTWFAGEFHGWQWYDTGQRHIITDITFRNCRSDWNGPCVYASQYNSCSDNSIWTILTHSDQFVPEVMQATRNITYDNVLVPRLVKFSTELTDAMGNTVSGLLASWFDADGSVYAPYLPSLRGTPVMLGSNWASEWWKYRDDCVNVSTAGVGLPKDAVIACPQRPGDASASVTLLYDQPLQSTIGTSLCMNGNWDGTKPCPVAATAAHFGRTEATGLAVGVNSKVTGPLIAGTGGWFVRFAGGTPSSFSVAGLVLAADTNLVLAFPYPAGTQFSIAAYVNYCDPRWSICVHPFRAVASPDEVRAGFGDVYHFDGSVLYVRIVFRSNSGSLGSAGTDAPWTDIKPVGMFQRNGLALPAGDYADIKRNVWDSYTNYYVTVNATTCASARCAAQPGVPLSQPHCDSHEVENRNDLAVADYHEVEHHANLVDPADDDDEGEKEED